MALAVVVTGCQSYTDPQTGRTTFSTPTLAQIMHGQVENSGSSAVGPTKWKNSVDGIESDAVLTPTGPGRYAFSDEGGGNACGMSVKGTATDVGGGRMRFYAVENHLSCAMELQQLDPNHLSVRETSCGAFHGVSCDFNGVMTKVSG